MATMIPSVQQNLGQPGVIPEINMSPRMQRQAVISNLAQNLLAAGRRGQIVNPAQALDQARQSQMGLNVQQSVLDDRARQEQALRQKQEAQQQQQAVLMEINKQYSGNPRGKFEALMQAGFTDVANKYADAMKSAGMPIVEEVKDTRTDDIKEFGEAYPTMVDKNGNVKDDPVSSAAFMAYMKDIKKSGASNINVGDGAFKEEMSLRKEFNELPQVKQWAEVKTQVDRLDQAMEASKTTKSNVPVDQSLIMIFNKMLDPESVVRESEYARTPKDLSLLSKIKGKWDKIQSGGAGLNDEEREAMYRMARRFGKVAQDEYQLQRQYYNELAQDYGFKPSNVLREFEPINFDDNESLPTLEPAAPVEPGTSDKWKGWSMRPVNQ